MNASVSVVMSVFNESEEFLRDAISSIKHQTFGDFEFIIVDDGSSDDNKNVLEGISQEDSRIKTIFRHENKGLAFSLNEAVSVAKGKYIARMDSDDIAHRQRFERQVSYMESNSNVAVVGTQARTFGSGASKKIEVPVSEEKIRSRLFFNSCFVHPTVMMRSEFFKSVGGYNINYDKAQDYELWSRGSHVGLVYRNIGEVLLDYRVYSSELSKKKVEHQRFFANKVRSNHLKNNFPEITDSAVNSFLYLASPHQSTTVKLSSSSVSELTSYLLQDKNLRASVKLEILRRCVVLGFKHRDILSAVRFLRHSMR